MPFLFLLSFFAADLLSSGRSAMERGEYADAERLFREQILKTPRSAEALSNLGAVLARENKLSDAVAAYKRALSADPNLNPVYLNLGIAFFRAGQFEAAIAPLDRFLKFQPNEIQALKIRAICLVESAQYPLGISELDRLNQRKPNDPSILFALAGAHIRAGNADQGKLLLQQLEGMNIPGASAHLLQGMLYYRSKLYEEAERELQEALRLDANSAATLAALGRLRLRVNDDPAATDYLQRALSIQPQDSESNYQLGVLLSRNGQEERGRQCLKRALEQRANFPDPMYFLGKMELSLNHGAEAVKYLEAASRLAPHQENITFLLARAYKETGQEARAKTAMTEVRQLQTERLKKDRAAMDPERAVDPTTPLSGLSPQ